MSRPRGFRRTEHRIRLTSEGDEHVLEAEQWVPRPRDEVFDFFSRETNLERLTPPQLQFHVLGKSMPEIQEGTLIDYRLSLRGIPMRWQTRIDVWEPGHRFVDTQLRGPYRLWHHTHTFEDQEGGTLMKDHVRFQLPFGILGSLLGGWLVKRDLRMIFDYRMRVIGEVFPRES